jgi:hypothetical protein
MKLAQNIKRMYPGVYLFTKSGLYSRRHGWRDGDDGH